MINQKVLRICCPHQQCKGHGVLRCTSNIFMSIELDLHIPSVQWKSVEVMRRVTQWRKDVVHAERITTDING